MLLNGNRSAALVLAAVTFTLAGCVTAVEPFGETFRTRLTGAEEVPGPGDPDGIGFAKVTIVDKLDRLCYEIDHVKNIGSATAAHIHRGPRGVAGPIVVPLKPPVDGDSSDCVKPGDAILDEIQDNPSNFYVNVHNAEFPAGAIRGQLR